MKFPFFGSKSDHAERKRMKRALEELRRAQAAYKVIEGEVSSLMKKQNDLEREKAELEKRQREVEEAVATKSASLGEIQKANQRDGASVEQAERAIQALMKERENAVKDVNAHLLTLMAQPFSGGEE